MRNLINMEGIEERMNYQNKVEDLEDDVSRLITEAETVVQTANTAYLHLYRGQVDYVITPKGILKYWKGMDHKGQSITHHTFESKQRFLGWLHTQPDSMKRDVLRNLNDYLKNPPHSESLNDPYL